MRFQFVVVVILLGFVQITSGYYWGPPIFGSRGRFFSGSSRAAPRPRMVRVFGTSCTGVACIFGAKCQMMPVLPCPGGNCTAPFCVSSAPVLPRVVSSVDNFGICPLSDPTVTTNGGIFCVNDTSCEINQKCCVMGSRIECVNVTSISLATFMARRLASIRRFFPSRTAGRQTPMAVGEGYCPTISATAFTDVCADGQSCAMDSGCPQRQQCCVVGCGMRCVNPVTIVSTTRTGFRRSKTKPAASNATSATMANRRGVCPTVAIDAVITNSTACSSGDMECSGSQKCCATGRGTSCLDPVSFMFLPSALTVSRFRSRQSGSPTLSRIRGSCPNVSPLINVPCGTQCANDSSCSSGTLCCSLEGCMQCVNPIISATFLATRPGICPSFSPNVTFSCDEECQEDSDCSNTEMKCCSMGCGKKCLNPVASTFPMIKAGTCPAASNVTSVFRSFRSRSSRWKRHSVPFFNRRRFVPVRQSSANACSFSFARFRSCLSDASCARSQKCCMNQCGGMSCTNPA